MNSTSKTIIVDDREAIRIHFNEPDKWVRQNWYVKRHKGWNEHIMTEFGRVMKHYAVDARRGSGYPVIDLPTGVSSIVGQVVRVVDLNEVGFKSTKGTTWRHELTNRVVHWLPTGATEIKSRKGR